MIPKPVVQAAESAIPVVREALENLAAVLGAFEKSAYEAWQIVPRVMEAPIRTIETLATGAATQEQMGKTAMDGSLAYLGMGGKANRFTQYLIRRFGSA